MSDARLRGLERAAQAGDAEAAERLKAETCRVRGHVFPDGVVMIEFEQDDFLRKAPRRVRFSDRGPVYEDDGSPVPPPRTFKVCTRCGERADGEAVGPGMRGTFERKG